MFKVVFLVYKVNKSNSNRYTTKINLFIKLVNRANKINGKTVKRFLFVKM